MAEAWDPIWYEDQIRSRRNPIKWVWEVFGDDTMVIELRKDVSWFYRMRTSLFLGSRWKKNKTPVAKNK
jgi:hypothetical protein